MKKEKATLPELKKGTLLIIKAPPYFTKEYLYEVISAGTKLIRATLYHSPTVRKSWTREELLANFEHGIVRLATDEDAHLCAPAAASEATNEIESDAD